jgi:competence protein ComEC
MAGVIVVFACVVGGDASVVRAAIMGSVGILATLYGRQYRGLPALLIAAAIMLAVNPLVLRHDVGFQLSFAAVCGLNLLAPGFYNLCPLRWRNGVMRILSETGAATLATMPVILHSFGRLPAVSLLANLLILPLIPWAMLFGTAAAIIGVLSISFAFVPALIAAWIMRLTEWLAVNCARFFPFVLQIQIGAVTMIGFYAGLLFLSLVLQRRMILQKNISK